MSVEEGLAAAAVFVLASGLVLAIAKARTAAIACTVLALLTMAAAGVTLVVGERQDVARERAACLRGVQQASRPPRSEIEQQLREARRALGTKSPTAASCD